MLKFIINFINRNINKQSDLETFSGLKVLLNIRAVFDRRRHNDSIEPKDWAYSVIGPLRLNPPPHPPMDEISNILTPKTKDQTADRNPV